MRAEIVDFIFEHSSDAVVLGDGETGLLRLNGAVVGLTGHQVENLLNQTNPHARAAGGQIAAALKLVGDGQWAGPLTCADGIDRSFQLILSRLGDDAQQIIGIMRIVQDETHAGGSHLLDSLTGLPSRTLFEDRVEQALLQASRSGRSVALVVLSLDRFVLVNDALGFAAGDRLLVEIAHRLKHCIRVVDTVVRLEGDKFALVMTLTGIDDSVIVAEKITAAIKVPCVVDGHEVAITASLGIGLYPQDAADAPVIIKHAERALHHAKLSGGNQYQFFSTELNRKARERLEIEARMRRALLNQEFVVYFQPKVRSSDGCIVGAEALVRWNDPSRGLIPPNHFIGVAEETGMIEELGSWVMRQSCLQNQLWQDAGLTKVCVSVNVSARQFRNRLFIETLHQILDETELDPVWLELEITESMLMRDVEMVVARMAELRALGVGLSIDDFGTGYSSLSYLGRFPITTLKIDRAFIIDVDTNPKTAEIARAIIGLSRGLNLEVVAEGCELEEHVKFLSDNGCSTVQGFYYSRPVPAAEFEELLRAGAIIPPR